MITALAELEFTVEWRTVVMVDEGEEEEIEENDLDCEGELGDMDVESPPWNFYGDDDIDCDDEIDDQEDTALLRASAAKTEIVITPMSPVSIAFPSALICLWVLTKHSTI